jgi:hypothetical protein
VGSVPPAPLGQFFCLCELPPCLAERSILAPRNSPDTSWPSAGSIPLLQLFTRRTGALLRWQRKRGILCSVKDPQHRRFDLWDRGLGQGSQSAAGARASGSWAALRRPRFPWFLWDWSGRISPASEMMVAPNRVDTLRGRALRAHRAAARSGFADGLDADRRVWAVAAMSRRRRLNREARSSGLLQPECWCRVARPSVRDMPMHAGCVAPKDVPR